MRQGERTERIRLDLFSSFIIKTAHWGSGVYPYFFYSLFYLDTTYTPIDTMGLRWSYIIVFFFEIITVASSCRDFHSVLLANSGSTFLSHEISTSHQPEPTILFSHSKWTPTTNHNQPNNTFEDLHLILNGGRELRVYMGGVYVLWFHQFTQIMQYNVNLFRGLEKNKFEIEKSYHFGLYRLWLHNDENLHFLNPTIILRELIRK